MIIMDKNSFLTKLQDEARRLLLPLCKRNNKKYLIKNNINIYPINEVKIPKEIIKQYDEVNNKLLYKKEIGPLLTDFIETLKKEMPEEYLLLLVNNMNTLKILFKDFTLSKIFLNDKTNGQYDIEKNTIEISKRNYKLTIIHELFHMASSMFDKENNTIFCGFFQLTPNIKIGEGLNEGYTQYLTEKYFSDKHSLLDAYSYEKTIAGILELIVGKNNMENFYFHANLKGLIDFLSQYIDKNEINNFFIYLDYINLIKDKNKLSYEEYYNLSYTFKKCNKFLAKLFINKFIRENNDIKDEETLISILSNFLNMLPANLENDKYKFNLSDCDYLKDDVKTFIDHYKGCLKIH